MYVVRNPKQAEASKFEVGNIQIESYGINLGHQKLM